MFFVLIMINKIDIERYHNNQRVVIDMNWIKCYNLAYIA